MARAAKKEESPVKNEKVAGIVNALKTRYPGRVCMAEEYTMPWLLKRLPTTVLDLDIALHGGLPAGGLSFFVGKQGVGKNWLSNQVIREQQRIYGDDCNIAVVSTEMVYDKLFARLCGITVALSEAEIEALDTQYREDLGFPMPEEERNAYRQQIGTFVTVPPDTAERSFEIALELIQSREFNVVLIDSFGSLLTELEEEKEFSDNNRVGGAALLNTRFARKLNYAMAPDEKGNPNLTCVIGINQARDNMDRANSYSPELKEGGGWALKHARWVTIDLAASGKVKKGTDVVGKSIRWGISKQKAGGHEGATGTFDFLYDRAGVDRTAHAIGVALNYGVLERAGASYKLNGNSIGVGLEAAANYLRENKLLPEIERKVLSAAGVRCGY